MTNVIKQTGQHTPGPWRLGANTSIGTFISTEEGHLLVCTVERLMIHEEELANAHLIAASPTMYAFITRKAQEGDADAAEILANIGQ